MSAPFRVVIPAGGSGTRLWPLSRANRPKFLLPLPGPRTMIQETVARLQPLCGTDGISIITGSAHADEVKHQNPDIDPDQIIIEPAARGSGPAIGLGAAIALVRDADAIVGSFAADHVVTDTTRFESAVRTAIEVAKRGYLVTIGIQPGYAETGYGYIRAGVSLPGINDGVAVVDAFKEKPDTQTARQYVESGQYLWNSSMFVWKASTLMEEMRALLPDLADALETIAADWDTPRREATFHRIWPTITEVTIDHGILERSDRVAVVPGTFGWTDLGDWHGFGNVLQRDGDGQENVIVNCDALTDDVQRSVIVGNTRTIAVIGLDNIVIVDTEDALLVCDRDRAQSVRNIVDALKHRGSTHLI